MINNKTIQINTGAFFNMTTHLCRHSRERAVWRYSGWWGGGATADVSGGLALCSWHTSSKRRFGLHFYFYGGLGSNGGVLAFWQGRSFIGQLHKGTLKVKALKMIIFLPQYIMCPKVSAIFQFYIWTNFILKLYVSLYLSFFLKTLRFK